MGVSFNIDYMFGFTWTFPDCIDDIIVGNIIELLYKLYDDEFYYVCAQYDEYFKSRKIMVGLKDKRLETKYLFTYISQNDIEEKFEKDNYLRNSPFLNYLHEYVNHHVENPEYGLCKQDFYDNRVELTEKSWEITERNDIKIEQEYGEHHYMIFKIFRFLDDVTDELVNNNNCDDIDIEEIWNDYYSSLTYDYSSFKWHTVIHVSY